MRGGGVKDYHINIFFSDEDDGYIADIPDLEACSAFGGSAEEALTEVERAKSAWIAAARAAGKTRSGRPGRHRFPGARCP